MTFRRGTTLPVATTLGHAESSDLGPTAGNGFYRRWPDDLALLSDLGVTDLRLTFDWARLQPKPGEFDKSWVERYENVFGAAEAIGMTVWATMYDSGVPKWFDNEGGLADDEATGRWWPRWVERVAEHFGDRVDGWIPFAVIPRELPGQVWTDTWGILEGGEGPVVASIDVPGNLSRVEQLVDQSTAIGLALDVLVDRDAEPTDEDIVEVGERWETTIHEVADVAPGRPLMISEFTPDHDDEDIAARLVERLVEILDGLEGEIDITTCLVGPAIAGPSSSIGLLDNDREPRPAGEVFLIAPDADDAPPPNGD